MAGQAANVNTSLKQLPTTVQRHILLLLPPNDRALGCRLACPDMRDALSEPQHCTASLSQPLPPYAVSWAVEAGQQHVQQLAFRHKLQLMCTAAASGSEVNLEVALALLQPSIFPESLLIEDPVLWQSTIHLDPDPGVAALEAGHPQLLGWLLHHCPELLRRNGVLQAAARHSALEGLQMAWRAVQAKIEGEKGGARRCWRRDVEPALGQAVLDVAAGSSTPDAVAKMEWLLSAGSCRLQATTASAAACSGDLGRLRWLRERGGPLAELPVSIHAARPSGDSPTYLLGDALQHADLAVVQWLVDEAGCKLPAVPPAQPHWNTDWDTLLRAAIAGPEAVAKLEWLQRRGFPLREIPSSLLHIPILTAADAGQTETLSYLMSVFGPRRLLLPTGPEGQGQAVVKAEDLEEAAASSGSIAMLEFLRQAGFTFSGPAYIGAAVRGNLALVRWLACEVGVPAAEPQLQALIYYWPNGTAADDRVLLEAVQLLVEVAGCKEWNVKDMLFHARYRRDMALVQYLLQQRPGYQPGGEVLARAAEVGCAALVEWLVQQPGWRPDPAYPVYIDAARHGDYATLSTLRRLGVPWGATDTLDKALQWGCRVPVLRWLVAQGVPVGGVGAVQDRLHGMLEWGVVSGEEAEWLLGYATGGASAAGSRGCMTNQGGQGRTEHVPRAVGR